MEILKDYYFIENQVGQVLIYTITALFLVAATNLFKYIWRYRISELNALIRLKKNVAAISANTSLAEKKELVLSGVQKSSLVTTRINAIFDIIGKNHVVEHEQLASITCETEKSRLGLIIISYISRTLILLGLLGTFFGLSTIALDFKALLGEIDTSNVNALITSMQNTTREISHVTGGITTAFTTTLWGLTGTLLLAAGSVILQHIQQDFLASLEATTAIKLLPLFNPPHITKAISESNRQLAESTVVIQKTIDDLKTAANDTFTSIGKMESVTEKLDTTANTFIAGATMISESNVAFSQTIGDLSGNVMASTNRDQKLFSNLNQIIKQTIEQQELIKSIVDFMRKSEITIEKIVSDCLNELKMTHENSLENYDVARLKYQNVINKSITNQNSLFELFLKNTASQRKEIVEAVTELNQEQLQLIRQIHEANAISNEQLDERMKRHERAIVDLRRNPHWHSSLSDTGRTTTLVTHVGRSLWVKIKLAFTNIFKN